MSHRPSPYTRALHSVTYRPGTRADYNPELVAEAEPGPLRTSTDLR
jgi:hypothetical protein